MTIEKGAPWGEPMAVEPEVVVAGSDAELAVLAASSPPSTDDGPVVLTVAPPGLATSDVARTVGVRAERPVDERLAFPFDLGWVAVDGEAAVPFVAGVVARRRRWAGRFAVVMNGGWIGDWYLGPRAHPNDGLLDVTTGSLSLQQRVLARRRVGSGSHLPHPGLTTARSPRWEGRFERPTAVRADGRPVGVGRTVEAWIEPDRFRLFM